MCAEFYFLWTIYRGITLKRKRLGLLILFCLLCIGYVLTSIVIFAFFFDLREEGTSSTLDGIIISIFRKIFVFLIFLSVVAMYELDIYITLSVITTFVLRPSGGCHVGI